MPLAVSSVDFTADGNQRKQVSLQFLSVCSRGLQLITDLLQKDIS